MVGKRMKPESSLEGGEPLGALYRCGAQKEAYPPSLLKFTGLASILALHPLPALLTNPLFWLLSDICLEPGSFRISFGIPLVIRKPSGTKRMLIWYPIAIGLQQAFESVSDDRPATRGIQLDIGELSAILRLSQDHHSD